MIKEQLRNLKVCNEVHSGEGSVIFQLDDGRLAKVARPMVLGLCQMLGTSYERKIEDTKARSVSEIVSPITGIYDGTRCCGYTMPIVKGENVNERENKLNLKELGDLNAYARLYAKIEEAVKKANKLGIVIPDLCTCDNIMIASDGSIKLIDYDGMQFGPQDASFVLSTSLGNPDKYVTAPKYTTQPFHFTTELDKTSLTMLMFLLVFHVDLKKLGTYNPFTRRPVDLKEMFDSIGLEDEQFINKVAANISDTQKGSYLTDDLMRVASNYDMEATKVPGVDFEFKRLIKRK